MGDIDKDIESAVTDPSTGLYNFQYFLLQMKRLISCSRRHKFPIIAIVISFNIDGKSSMGNGEKKSVLKSIGDIVNNSIRWDSDIAARMEENKIGILLVHCKNDEAPLVVKRLIDNLRQSDLFLKEERGVSLSLKIGYSSLDLSHDALSLLKDAEESAQITEII
jgi:diguanylate cyclase (GGDEF)-like protein